MYRREQLSFCDFIHLSTLLQGNIALSAIAGIEGHTQGQESRHDPRDIGKDVRGAIVVVGKHGRRLGDMRNQAHAYNLESGYISSI